VTTIFSHPNGTDGYIFYNNITNTNSSYQVLSGVSDTGKDSISLPSTIGNRFLIRVYFNNSLGTWINTIVIGETHEPNRPSIDNILINETRALRDAQVNMSASDVEGLAGYIFWNNVTNAPGGVNSTWVILTGTMNSTINSFTVPDPYSTTVGIRYYVNDTDGYWVVSPIIMFPSSVRAQYGALSLMIALIFGIPMMILGAVIKK